LKKAEEIRERDPECRLCEELKRSKLEHRCLWGEGKGPIMLVGQCPGTKEDIKGVPFIGPAGNVLRKILGDKVQYCYITNVVKCYYKTTPTQQMVKNCLPYLLYEIVTVKPKVIITLGEVASMALLRKKKIQDISFIPQTPKIKLIEHIPVFATYHPAAVIRKGNWSDVIRDHIRTTIKVAWEYINRTRNSSYGKYTIAKDIPTIETHLTSVLAIDVETSGLYEFEEEARIRSIALSPSSHQAVVIPWDENYWQDKWQQVRDIIKKLLTNSEQTLIGHNLKFDLRWLIKDLGLQPEDIKCNIEDTILMHHLIDEIAKHSLSSLAFKYTDMGGYDREVLKKGGPLKVEGEELYLYNAADADVTHRLYIRFKDELTKEGTYWRPYRFLLIPATKALLAMEHRGAPADRNFLLWAYKKLQKEYNSLLEKINSDSIVRELFPQKDFNPFSYNHMSKLCSPLLQEGKIPVPRTKNDKESWNKEFLRKAGKEYPVFEWIAELRKIRTLSSHIREQYLPAIHNGKIHPSFTLFIARSGRTASQNPNCQNLYKGELHGVKIRNMIYAPKGYLLLSADFSLHEVRVAAALSKDPKLISLLEEGKDIHSATAATIEGIPYEEFLKKIEGGDPEFEEKRRKAKTVVFGVMYGMTARGLAQRLEISEREAKRYIESFFTQYRRLQSWIKYIVSKAKQEKRIKTPFDRYRSFRWDYDFERKAINFPIQSAASDLLLLGLSRVHEKFMELKVKSHPILEVHDEILFLMKKEEMDDLLPLIREILENPQEEWLKPVQLKVDFSVGERWGELEKT